MDRPLNVRGDFRDVPRQDGVDNGGLTADVPVHRGAGTSRLTSHLVEVQPVQSVARDLAGGDRNDPIGGDGVTIGSV
ncbi:hypothetical protein AWB85_13610 [Mycobacteroides immunogenum]|uniref:Uncharacterized protein n=1 Tax=Mycobacteroides immunogenum TaxID=83262 RepID=A0A179V882_9MYCO|nr:hypothetical protein AWB85_13610 [Mycobacteroides immunogenum]